MTWNKICVESFRELLRFGRKNSGGWDECEDHDFCEIPDDSEADQMLRDARLGAVVREYREATKGCWPGNNDLWWEKFEKADTTEII